MNRIPDEMITSSHDAHGAMGMGWDGMGWEVRAIITMISGEIVLSIYEPIVFSMAAVSQPIWPSEPERYGGHG